MTTAQSRVRAAAAALPTIVAASTLALLAFLALSLLVLLAVVPAAGAASGDLAWQRVYNGLSNGVDAFNAAAPAPNGGVYVAGYTPGTSVDLFVARYDAAGQR
ncbi:MAG TPA: hypothetical protein VJ787_02660, partial [Thermoleophilia bacterium]|nr:hypothetical protein [Thermoleophilia bacterium]